MARFTALARWKNSRACSKLCSRNLACEKMIRKFHATPNGSWSVVPVSLSTVAWILCISSTAPCTFITRQVTVDGEVPEELVNYSAALFRNIGIGFWGWQDEDDGKCYSYSIGGNGPTFDVPYTAANVFTTMTTLLGGMAMVYTWLGTCFVIMSQRYKHIGYIFLLTFLFQALTLVMLQSNVCAPGFFSYMTTPAIPNLSNLTETSCSLGTGSILSLVSAIFWCLAGAVCLCSPLAAAQNNNNNQNNNRTSIHQNGQNQPFPSDRFLDDEDNDETKRLYDERRRATEQRYREMFGDDDESYGNERINAFRSFRKPALSEVREDDDIETEPFHGHGNMEDRSRSQYSNDDDDDDDDRSRSPYSRGGGGGGEHRDSVVSQNRGNHMDSSNFVGDHDPRSHYNEERSQASQSYESRSQRDDQSQLTRSHRSAYDDDDEGRSMGESSDIV